MPNYYAIIRINTDKKGKELPSNLKAEKKLHSSLVRIWFLHSLLLIITVTLVIIQDRPEHYCISDELIDTSHNKAPTESKYTET